MSQQLLRLGIYVSVIFTLLSACSTSNQPSKQQQNIETAWLNPLIFEQQIENNDSLEDIKFNIEFTGTDKKPFFAKGCSFILQSGDDIVVDWEYDRWQWLKANCVGANRYFNAPKTAYSFWPELFDFETIKHLPASAIPNLGGESLEGRTGSLSSYDKSLTFVAASRENSISVEVDGLEVHYTQVARADFNRDGYQDIFIRMDWFVKDAFGKGTDWVVLTKLSSVEDPMLLWRN